MGYNKTEGKKSKSPLSLRKQRKEHSPDIVIRENNKKFVSNSVQKSNFANFPNQPAINPFMGGVNDIPDKLNFTFSYNSLETK